jgi:predicted ribosome quality control (RQC) complex YloA/Tae2 family protein
MEADLARTGQADELARQAEALKASLHRVHKGEVLVVLPDFSDPEGGNIEIHLEPSLDPVQNMQKLFARSRRLTAARSGITSRLNLARSDLDDLEQRAVAIAPPLDLAALQAVEERWHHEGFLRRRKASKGRNVRRQAFRTYQSATGKPILVGRSGPDNHELTFRVAKGSDLWMHARNRPGAHVVVRLERGEEIDPQTLTDAATMAAFGAGAKVGDKVEVGYTRAKHVHPIKGAAPGLVSVAKGRTLLVQIDADRLARIQKTHEK